MPTPAKDQREVLADLWDRLGDAEHNMRLFKKQPAALVTEYRHGVARKEILRLRKKIAQHIEKYGPEVA